MTISDAKIEEIAGYAAAAYLLHSNKHKAADALQRRCRQHGLSRNLSECLLLIEAIDQYDQRRKYDGSGGPDVD